MKTYKLLMVALSVTALAAPAMAAAKLPLETGDREKVADVQKVKSEISLLNLLNGLYLSSDQLDKLIALAERAAELRGKYVTDLSKESDRYVRELAALRDALYTPTGATEEAKSRAVTMEIKVDLDPMRKLAEELGRIEDEARTVLNDGQVAVIENFKPCLIPPKTLADPVAVGQASTTDREEQALDVIRRMPDALYKQRRELIAGTIIARGEREKGKVPEDVRQNMAKTYLKKMDDMRRMSDVDFALKKKDIAKDFQLFDDDATYRKGHTRELGSISNHLLNERALETMKKWREARKDDPAETELAAVSGGGKDDRKTQIQARILMGYEMQARALVRERLLGKKLRDQDARQMDKALLDSRKETSADKRFQAVDAVVDKCNAVTVTKTSVEALMTKIACLCFTKRVSGVVQPPWAKGKPVDDITGLGETVEQARADLEAGQTAKAYAALVKVADSLKQFKD